MNQRLCLSQNLYLIPTQVSKIITITAFVEMKIKCIISAQKSLLKEIPETAKTPASTKSVGEPTSSNASIGNIENSGATSSTPTNSSPSQSLLENSVDSDTRKGNFRKPSVIPTTSNSIFRRYSSSVSSPKRNAATPNSKGKIGQRKLAKGFVYLFYPTFA